MANFTCPTCGKVFTRRYTLKRHVSEKHEKRKNYVCSLCNARYYRRLMLDRHMHRDHGAPVPSTSGVGTDHEEDEGSTGSRNDNRPEEEEEEGNDARYKITKVKSKRSAKFKTVINTFKLRFNSDFYSDNIASIYRLWHAAIEHLLNTVMRNIQGRDLIQLVLHNSDLDYPIQIPFTRRDNITAEAFLAEIERVLQSFEEFVIDGSLYITISHIAMPVGGRPAAKYIKLDRFLKEKKCIIRILNYGCNLCCGRAIVTAKAKLEDTALFHSLKRYRKRQMQSARDLYLKGKKVDQHLSRPGPVVRIYFYCYHGPDLLLEIC